MFDDRPIENQMTFFDVFSTVGKKFATGFVLPVAIASMFAAMLIGSTSVMAMQDAASPSAGGLSPDATEAAGEDQVKQKIAERRQFYYDAVLQELDNMVPGEYEEGSPQKAELERAVEAFLDRDIDTLNEILQQQAAFDPDFPPRHLLLASLSYHVRDPGQGHRLLEKAAVESPNYPGTYAAFARLALNEGRITDALTLLEKCDRLASENNFSEKVKEHFGKQYVAGMLQVAIAQNRFQDARDLLKQQMEQLPDSPKSFLTGADIEFQAGNLKGSQAYLEKVQTMIPDARPFESVFARWFRKKGNVKEAGKWIEAAAEKYPDDGAAQMDHVNWLMAKGDLASVQAALPKVEAITGSTIAIDMLKGQLAFADDKMDQAESLLLKVIEGSKGRNLEAVNLYALALSESADPKKQQQAQQIAQQTLGRLPRNNVAKASLAYILLQRGETEQPQRLLLPVVRSERVSSEIAYFFGCLLNSLDKNEAARKALQSALQTDELFLYRKKCKNLLDKLGGPIASDLPAPVESTAPTDSLPPRVPSGFPSP